SRRRRPRARRGSRKSAQGRDREGDERAAAAHAQPRFLRVRSRFLRRRLAAVLLGAELSEAVSRKEEVRSGRTLHRSSRGRKRGMEPRWLYPARPLLRRVAREWLLRPPAGQAAGADRNCEAYYFLTCASWARTSPPGCLALCTFTYRSPFW